MRRIALIVSIAIALVVFARLRYPGRAPPATGCDPDLWPHVYRPDRLRVVTQCATAAGRVTAVHSNQDGDLHVEIDPDDPPVLNLVNLMHGHGRLIVEAVCDHDSAQADARAACAGFSSKIAAPAVGSRIRATGAYVKDRENGWMEIHPVTKIETLPSRP